MLSWWEPRFGEEEATAVAEVVRSGYVNEGVRTGELSERLQAMLGARHVLATCNGTVALYLALRACGVRPGDEVIVPDLTFIATASAVAMCNARPVLADCRAADLNIDPEKVAAAVTERTRAILPVHVNGRCADMEPLREIAGHHGLALIEDAAEALGSRHGGRALGALADVGCISLAPTKIITSGQGGLVVTDRDDIRDAVVRLKDHGRLSRSWNYHPEIGFNFKYSDIYAAVALAQLDRLPQRLDNARAQYRRYAERLDGLPGLQLIATDVDGGAVPLWVDALVDDADGLREHLRSHEIDCRPFWPALHTQAPYQSEGAFPVAEDAARRGVWFPSGAGKTDADIDRVCDAVAEYLQR